MSQKPKIGDQQNKRVLLVTHHLDAGQSMESRLSWFRAVHSAERYDTTVVCATSSTDRMEQLPSSQRQNLHILTVPHTLVENVLKRWSFSFYLAYRLWHRRVFKRVSALHAERPFDLVHQVSYCGYREPGECWKLDAPFVWGPIGGTHNVAWNFLSQLDWPGAILEMIRNGINFLQLRYSPRVRRTLKAADCVVSANQGVQQAIKTNFGRDTHCRLETGLEEISEQLPERRSLVGRPLRILWSGRLEAWKALPLLLKALADLPSDVPYQLRVVGDGSRRLRWQSLATKLGLGDRVEWAGWPKYDSRNEHYQWADVFAFTSLRDTSGTGLLESLAAGVPIIGLDHQGARDIMTDECAVRIAVQSPKQVISDIRSAVVQLAANSKSLESLRAGALQRARNYHWDTLGEEMMQHYESAFRASSASQSLSAKSDTQVFHQSSSAAALR